MMAQVGTKQMDSGMEPPVPSAEVSCLLPSARPLDGLTHCMTSGSPVGGGAGEEPQVTVSLASALAWPSPSQLARSPVSGASLPWEWWGGLQGARLTLHIAIPQGLSMAPTYCYGQAFAEGELLGPRSLNKVKIL